MPLVGATLEAEKRAASPGGIPDDPVAAVRAVLDRPDAELDYARAKIAFDRIIDPSVDAEAVLVELDRLTRAARELAGPAASEADKLCALRKLIYEGGPWNGWRSFKYDHSNIRGQNVRLKLLSNYLAKRRGDCVSMPVLYLILAEKMGFDMALTLAPNHLLLNLRIADGRNVNLEATSGALPIRDEWLRSIRPMSDRSIESGMYLRRLSRREGVAAMAVSVVQYLREAGRFEEAAAVCDLILANNPRDGLILVNLAVVYRRLGVQLLERYPSEPLIPLNTRLRYWVLATRHHAAYAAARALGWEDVG